MLHKRDWEMPERGSETSVHIIGGDEGESGIVITYDAFYSYRGNCLPPRFIFTARSSPFLAFFALQLGVSGQPTVNQSRTTSLQQ